MTSEPFELTSLSFGPFCGEHTFERLAIFGDRAEVGEQELRFEEPDDALTEMNKLAIAAVQTKKDNCQDGAGTRSNLPRNVPDPSRSLNR